MLAPHARRPVQPGQSKNAPCGAVRPSLAGGGLQCRAEGLQEEREGGAGGVQLKAVVLRAGHQHLRA